MSSLFTLDPALRIGTVFEVSGTAIKVALLRDIEELSRLHQGRVYTVGQIGSLVRLRMGRRLLFAVVRGMRLQTEEEAAAVAAAIDAERRVLDADLIGEGFWNQDDYRLSFSRGLSISALPMQEVHLLTDEESYRVYAALESSRSDNATFVTIGEYVGSSNIPVRADIDRMFGQHCAILGSTGTGKSSAVAAIIRSVLESSIGDDLMCPRIVIIDPHGEYGRAFQKEAEVYKAYGSAESDESDSRVLKLPYWLMSSDEFRSLIIGKTEYEATSQANTVYKALTHARMVACGLIEPARDDWNGKPLTPQHPEEPRPTDACHLAKIGAFNRDLPIPFSLAEFRDHIEKEQCLRFKSGKWERVADTDWQKDYASILNKLKVLESDARIKFMMKDFIAGSPDLSEILKQFVSANTNGKHIRIIDISGIPNEVAGLLTSAIARILFQYKLSQTHNERRKDPVLLVCEEAHRYVPDRGEAQYASAQSAIRRIAREGRKYGIGLMLVSQRPSDVEGTVISQCGTWVVLRLTNTADQAQVRKFLPDSMSGLVDMLPVLPRREALFVGEGSALPARIRLRYLEEHHRPHSDDIAFGAGWRTPDSDANDVGAISSRMSS